MEMSVIDVRLECPLYDGVLGVPMEELSTVLYLRRAFMCLGCSHPNEDVAMFSSILDGKMYGVPSEDLKRKISDSVNVLFHHVVTGEGDGEKAYSVSSGLVAVYLSDALKELWKYHESEGIDQEDDVMLSAAECMHNLKAMMFSSRPSYDTASEMMTSTFELASLYERSGERDKAEISLLTSLAAPDYLYLHEEFTSSSTLAFIAALHVKRAMMMASDMPEDSEREYKIAFLMFRDAGRDECLDYAEHIAICSRELGVDVF